MPNWVKNSIRFYSDEDMERAKEILLDKELLEQGVEVVTFNNLVPAPKTPQECVDKYGTRYIDNGDFHLMHDESTAWFNWYGWNFECWGTKWDACHTEIFERQIEFDTAWSYPYAFAEAFVEKMKSEKIHFIWKYADECVGSNCGEFWVDGEPTVCYRNDAEDHSTDAYRISLDAWGLKPEDIGLKYDVEKDEYVSIDMERYMNEQED